jgi:hypothetical protein
MTDRELLELAAKAAGLDDYVWHAGYGMVAYAGGSCAWNPLHSDSDALMLGVKLGEKYVTFVLGVFNRAMYPYASASVVHRDGSETYIEQTIEDNIGAATRLAIVRCAAEIGKEVS